MSPRPKPSAEQGALAKSVYIARYLNLYVLVYVCFFYHTALLLSQPTRAPLCLTAKNSRHHRGKRWSRGHGANAMFSVRATDHGVKRPTTNGWRIDKAGAHPNGGLGGLDKKGDICLPRA